MKIIACLTSIAFIVTGCTTLRPMQLSRSEDSERIIIGNSIHSGDKVQITTSDGKEYTFKVTSVEDDFIKGKDVKIPVKDITAIEKRKFSRLKTTFLIGGIVYTLYIIGEMLAAPAFILSGG
jgi:hypothetical protein